MTLPEYASFDEKKAYFQLNYINNEQEFDEFYTKIKSENSLFRGISNAKYKIFNSLQRQWLKEVPKGQPIFDNFVRDYFKEHQTTLVKDYFKGLNITPSFLSISSFLQHYGAPSPLIDFTPSIDVSLYFATENIPASGKSDLIDGYFSIFQIKEDDFELISDNASIKGIGESVEFWSKYTDERGEPIFNQFLDTTIEVHTEKVFLVPNSQENKSVYNSLSSLNIIAQKGLFIYNGYEDKPLEEALHIFFERGAQFQSSIHDELYTPESAEINRVYFEETLPRNRAYQKRLKENIVHSYEISKSLVPYIKGKLTLKESSIYPNPSDIGWGMFEAAKAKTR